MLTPHLAVTTQAVPLPGAVWLLGAPALVLPRFVRRRL
jgi:hypothetical protein